MKWFLVLVLVLALSVLISAAAQNPAWQDAWKEVKLPPGWNYATTGKAGTPDIFGVGEKQLLGKIVFAKDRHWQVTYYAYYTHDTEEARAIMDKYRQNSRNNVCWKNNIPAGKGEFTVKAQGYTSYLQVDDVLYLLDDCHTTPCPYTPESWAFVRSLLEFMQRSEE